MLWGRIPPERQRVRECKPGQGCLALTPKIRRCGNGDAASAAQPVIAVGGFLRDVRGACVGTRARTSFCMSRYPTGLASRRTV